jgi:hypothetical protein
MINEKRTFEEFGYYSIDLTRGSHKRVYRICNICNAERAIRYDSYNKNEGLCMKCANSKIQLSDKTLKKMSKATSGENNPNYGKHHTEKTKQKISATKQEIFIDDWVGYSELRYDIKFNTKLKKQVRALTNNCDFLTGKHKKICNNGNELDVHHIDYNKNNSDITNLIPLSKSNHARTNTNRAFWTKLFTNMQQTKYLLEGIEIDEDN